MSFKARLERRIARQVDAALFRRRIELTSGQRPDVTTADGDFVNFCSNDYLGLAGHPAVVEAMSDAASRHGAGAGASHLVTGHMRAHHELEARLASWCGAERALLFGSGYLANLALVTTLAGRGTRLVADRLNHASLVDAGILSRATVRRYAHADAGDAARRLQGGGDDALIVTDSVFSMDGDVAPLEALDALAGQYGAALVVDDAHGFGVLGEGRGALLEFGLSDHAVLMGTLGKALGVYGAFVAGPSVVIESLIQFARPYIYTTALPPAVAAACGAALELVRTDVDRRRRLFDNIARFRRGAKAAGIEVVPSETAIQPVLLGDSRAALEASRRLKDAGFLVTAIRPPTVPKGTARLRITLSAAHEPAHVDGLLRALPGAIEAARLAA